MPGTFTSDTRDKMFFFTPYTGNESIMFMDGYGMQVFSGSKIYINAPEIELFGSNNLGTRYMIDGQNFYEVYSMVVANAADIQAIKTRLNM